LKAKIYSVLCFCFPTNLIYEQRLQNPAQKFQSIEDVIINVSDIKETTMQKMIDAWQFMKYCFGHQNLLLGKEFK
jgi:hypothetical protein